MAVASFQVEGVTSTRGFHPPKTASLTHWYRAATKQMPDAPDWRTIDLSKATVTADVIHFCGESQDLGNWDLFIARKRNLK